MPRPRTLKCPYTGVVQTIVLDDTLGRRNGFHLDRGLDLTLPFLSLQDAANACPDGVDRYTGKPLALVELRPGSGLWHYPDAYSPAKRWNNRDLAEYHGSMRKGHTFVKRPASVKITEREPPPPDPFADRKAAPDIEPLILDTMEQIAKEQA